jgi:hypothetical protein
MPSPPCLPVATMTERYALRVATVQQARRVVSRIRRVSAYLRFNLNLRPPVLGTENTAAIARFGAPMPLDTLHSIPLATRPEHFASRTLARVTIERRGGVAFQAGAKVAVVDEADAHLLIAAGHEPLVLLAPTAAQMARAFEAVS